MDAQGRVLLRTSIPAAASHEVDIAHLAPGLYLFSFEQGNRMKQHKIIKR
jgi:hypothetical protein